MQYQRLWVVMSTPVGPDHPVVQQQLLPAIGSAFQLAGGRDFNRTWVYLLAPRRTASR